MIDSNIWRHYTTSTLKVLMLNFKVKFASKILKKNELANICIYCLSIYVYAV